MSAPKRILSLSGQDYKILIRCILEYRNELIQEKECATMMSRNVFVSFKTPDNIGVLDFMVIRNEEDYVRSVTSRVRNQEIYDQLAEYICSNYVPGQTYLTLPADLHQALNCYCYILPLADIANSELEVGG